MNEDTDRRRAGGVSGPHAARPHPRPDFIRSPGLHDVGLTLAT